MAQPLRVWEALYGLFVLAVGGAAIAWALLSWLTDQEMRATVLTCSGTLLAAWSGARLSPSSPSQ